MDGLTALILSREELTLLLRLLHARTLPGLGAVPLAGYNEEQDVIAVRTAHHSLEARGLLEISEADRRVRIDPLVAGTLAACLAPLWTLSLVRVAGDDVTAMVFYHVAKRLVIEQAIVSPHLVQFSGTKAFGDFRPTMLDLIPEQSHERQPAMPPIHVAQETFGLAQDAMRAGNHDVAYRALIAGGLDQTSAQVAMLVLDRSAVSLAVTLSRRNEPFVVHGMSAFALVEARDHLWAVTPRTDTEGQTVITIEHFNQSAAQRRIGALLRAALDAGGSTEVTWSDEPAVVR